MKLDRMTWPEVEAYLRTRDGVIIPTGSIEQHGPIGLIGTDALCAEAVADGAAERTDAISAPCLAYAPAPFNMAFPGTVSIGPELFLALAEQVIDALATHGFRHFYFLNGHGANLAPLARLLPPEGSAIRIRSWWDFEEVNVLRRRWYGDWEGMHATPSEVAITQTLYRIVPADAAARTPPRRLGADYVRAHSGDRHGPPAEHRRDFPDGRVGSHSALAKPKDGEVLVERAVAAVARDYIDFCACAES